jgi:hypothetical protein
VSFTDNQREFLRDIARAQRQLKSLAIITANRLQERAGRKVMRPFRRELKAAASTVPRRSGELRKPRAWKMKSKIYRKSRGAWIGVGAQVYKRGDGKQISPGKYAHLVDQPFRHHTGPKSNRRFTGMTQGAKVFERTWERNRATIGHNYAKALKIEIDKQAARERARR